MQYQSTLDLWLARAVEDPDLAAELGAVRSDPDAVTDRFYRDLAFGTGGLRGVIGAGTNRMNLYTVRRATQGLADYLNASGLPKFEGAAGMTVMQSLMAGLRKAPPASIAGLAVVQPALHHGHAALGEVLADELRGAAPGHHVDEIRLLLAALGLEVPVHGQGEGRDSGAVSGTAQLRVPGQTTHDDDLVEHGGCLLTRLCRRSGNA